MKLGRGLLVLLIAGASAVLIAWLVVRKSAPPEVPFVKVKREAIVSTLNTNGKVEPIQWASARAERAGVIKRVLIQRGQQVRKGAALVELDTRDASAQLENAEAQIQQAKAQLRLLDQGGPSVERAQIEGDIERAKLDLQVAQKEHASLQRLAAKQAATQVEVNAARQRADQLQLQIQALEQRRAALVAPPDKEIAQAKLEQAETAARLARANLALSTVSAPIDGIVYQFDLRIGSFVNAGDLIANIGRLDRVRVVVYVDEPELGRVHEGQPVVITWDAMPDRQWKGVVDKLPTQVVPLGSRQVGEVSCLIENPDHDLLPGTNINAEIQSSVVPNALTVPRVALRREGSQTGVLVLSGDHVTWRTVKLGVSSYTKSQVLSGLAESDPIALPTEKPIKDGSKVDPVYP